LPVPRNPTAVAKLCTFFNPADTISSIAGLPMIRFFIVFTGIFVGPYCLAQSVPAVGVFLDFDSVPGTTSVDVMKKEVDSLLKGVKLNWRLLSENHGNEPFAGLVVLRFKGSCKVEPWGQEEPEPGSRRLGATKVVNGRVIPFSEVQCDQIRKALAYLRPEASQREKQKALGLALGRVVAHELYHMLAHTTAHAARGLAKAAESLQDLVSDSVPMAFRAEDGAAIRQNLTPPPPPAVVGTDIRPGSPQPPY
jgi:hypothetical protein